MLPSVTTGPAFALARVPAGELMVGSGSLSLAFSAQTRSGFVDDQRSRRFLEPGPLLGFT